MYIFTALIVLPIVGALLAFIPQPKAVKYGISALIIGALSLLSVMSFGAFDVAEIALDNTLLMAITVADFALLGFFVHQGIKYRHKLAWLLAVVQLGLLIYLESIISAGGTAPIIIDDLSKFMYLIINVVGGLIILYAIKYIEDEETSEAKKRYFTAVMFGFLAVMNAIVSANSMMLFFFLFEMTTLASYLLISFRDDEISRTNALKALWMNQVGGVAILLALIVSIMNYNTISFDILIFSNGGAMLFLAMAFVSMAALVKGASVPFESWLLGAMAAPTPVSAMLHSATMVKIAPFLILKLSIAISMTKVGLAVAVIGSAVFVVATYMALARSSFKEILGYSTIALLALMMALASVDMPHMREIAIALMIFHALSKALLFLTAGVLEKEYDVKNIEDMGSMIERSRLLVGFIIFGFISLTLPPFGLFLGKLFAIESFASLIKIHPIFLFSVICVVIGSAMMVMLYFKVASALLAHRADVESIEYKPSSKMYTVPLFALSALIVAGAIYYLLIQSDKYIIYLAIPMMIAMFLPLFKKWLDRFDRVKPYMCGEKLEFEVALTYYEPSKRVLKAIYIIFSMLFLMVAVMGVLS